MSIMTRPPDVGHEAARLAFDYDRFRRDFSFDPPRLPGRDDCHSAAAIIARHSRPDTGQDQWVPSGGAGLAQSWGPHGEIVTYTARTTAGHKAVLVGSDGGIGTHDGGTFRVGVSPGALTLRRVDVERRERTGERSRSASRARVEIAASYLVDGEELPEGISARTIYEWSPKSRARMFRTIPQLDLSDWLARGYLGYDNGLGYDHADTSMLTLTFANLWQNVAPRGKDAKAVLRLFQKRWEHWIGPWRVLWKQEFQERGAPHYHLLVRVPVFVGAESFNTWVSRTWAQCCRDAITGRVSAALRAHDTEGAVEASLAAMRYELAGQYKLNLAAGTTVSFDQSSMSDPRRISTYFLGHSSKHLDGKEYQHIVPREWRTPGAGPGRFWGYAGLELVNVEVDVSGVEAQVIARAMRGVMRARQHLAQLAGAENGKDHREVVTWARRVLVDGGGAAAAPVLSDPEWARAVRGVESGGIGPLAGVSLPVYERRVRKRKVHRRRSLRSFRAGGGLNGGTVIVNDGVTLALGVARLVQLVRVVDHDGERYAARAAG